jgi:hypothetical protein
LHATVQAWQPMHLRLSMTNPYLMPGGFGSAIHCGKK